jgi:hypothetical protein
LSKVSNTRLLTIPLGPDADAEMRPTSPNPLSWKGFGVGVGDAAGEGDAAGDATGAGDGAACAEATAGALTTIALAINGMKNFNFLLISGYTRQAPD